jgi:hypothetical protein
LKFAGNCASSTKLAAVMGLFALGRILCPGDHVW